MIGGIAAITAAAVIAVTGAVHLHHGATSTRSTQAATTTTKKPTKKPKHNAPQPVRSFLDPFPEGSVWSAPLNDVKIDPQTAAKMQYFVENSVKNPSMSLRRYGWTIVQASEADPVYAVRLGEGRA